MSYDAFSFGVGADSAVSTFTTAYQLPAWLKSSEVSFNKELPAQSVIDVSMYAKNAPVLSNFKMSNESLGDSVNSETYSSPSSGPYVWDYN